MKRTFKVLLVLTLFLSAYVAWSGFTERELVWPVSALLADDHEVTGTDPDFRDLQVVRGPSSQFDGTISVENPTGDFQDVFVTVDTFDGDQNIGEHRGNVTLKPRSASSVDLSSLDEHTTWTDAHVNLLRVSS